MNNKEQEERLEECIAYFTQRKGFNRAFQAMQKKWRQYGRPAGIVKIEKPSAKERQALEGFFAEDFSEGSIRFSMKEWEAVLGQTRFSGITLEELLKGYFKENLVTSQEEKLRKAEKKAFFFQELLDTAVHICGQESMAVRWLNQVVNEKRYGYQMICKEYAKDQETTSRQVEAVCRGMGFLERKKGIRLAVLGAEVTKNPHEFDRNTAAGNLLIQGLGCINGGMVCKSAEDILMLYYASGIRPDDISSFTTAYGIHLYTEEGEHPASKGFIEMGEPFVVTLSNLSRIKSAGAKHKKVYVIENQMVFSHLCEGIKGREAALLCTSGQVKTASWLLLDLLCEAGCRIFYCGDLDPEGIGIAEKILARAGACAQLWHMSKADYDLSVSEEDISPERLNKLEKIRHPALAEVKEAVLRRKKAGYQEQLIEVLQAEIGD